MGWELYGLPGRPAELPKLKSYINIMYAREDFDAIAHKAQFVHKKS